MRIEPFQSADIDPFLELAGAEGWISDRWEFDFLLSAFPGGCLVGRIDRRAVAFVTAIVYGTSGWIGNLIVAPGERGKGYGAFLIRRAFDVLGEAGAQTVWLTASPAGKPIYERLGFREVDVIKRWHGKVSGPGFALRTAPSLAGMAAIDRAGWGDGREKVLSVVARRGTVFGVPDGFLVAQPSPRGAQFGPWGCGSKDGAGTLLDQGLSALPEGTDVLLDVPVRNVAAASLLHARGFAVCGGSSLMFAGREPAYVPEKVYALASMGSMG